MNWKKHIHALLDAGMTLDKIAASMGVTTNAVREILAGRTKSPRADAAIRLLRLRPHDWHLIWPELAVNEGATQ